MKEAFECVKTPHFRVVAIKEAGHWRFILEDAKKDAMGNEAWVTAHGDLDEIIRKIIDAVIDGRTTSFDQWWNSPPVLKPRLEDAQKELHRAELELASCQERSEDSDETKTKKNYRREQVQRSVEHWKKTIATIEEAIRVSSTGK